MQYDPVTLDIIWSRLNTICDEAETGLQRTAFSEKVREGRDFCCQLLNTEGESIAQGSISLNIFASSSPLTAQKILETFPAETLEPGDIVITNDPWVNAGHLYDVFALEPIFHKGKLIALAGSVAHWPDIGGRGEMPENRSIFEDGLQLPIIKIAKRGQFNEEVLQIIRGNVRFPDMLMGDFQSQLIGNNLMRTKLIELMESQGIEDFGVVSETILARSEAGMRSAIAQVPDGDYENEIRTDGIDRELTVKVKVSVQDTNIHVDYAGSSPQTGWAINSMPNYSYAYTFIAIKAALAPYLPNNSGQMRPVSISMPVGSIVNPRLRSVGAASRNVVGNLCCSATFGALGKAIPQQAQAESSQHANLRIHGESESGGRFLAQGSLCSGMGARHNGDGLSVILWPPSGTTRPIEMTEYLSPQVLFERKEIKTDSGGVGKYRGGCGQEVEARIIGRVSSGQYYPVAARIVNRAQGLRGGGPGTPQRVLLNGEPIAGMRTATVEHGDRITQTTAGGGGFGNPLEREPALVLEDVLDQLVSQEQAEAGYGVVIDATTNRIDWEATALCRSRRLQQKNLSLANQPVGTGRPY